jgi:hypothetical protein
MSKEKETGLTLVQEVNYELAKQTKDPATMRALMAVTFKGFKNEQLVRQACLEAMLNGYSFQDLVRKKVDAIPFGGGYSLVQSIGDARATAMANGQIGKSAPVFEETPEGKIKTCTVTVKRMANGTVGDYTATVYFDEYNKDRDNWKTKPRTMIAKVAEMHALRMAFPEKLAKAYIEDEFRDDGVNARMGRAEAESEGLKMGNLATNANEKEDSKENQNSGDNAEGDENQAAE